MSDLISRQAAIDALQGKKRGIKMKEKRVVEAEQTAKDLEKTLYEL